MTSSDEGSARSFSVVRQEDEPDKNGENGGATVSAAPSRSGWGSFLDSLRRASGLITLCALMVTVCAFLVAMAILATSYIDRLEAGIMNHVTETGREITLQIATSELRVTKNTEILDAEIEDLERELYDLGIRVSVIEQDRKKR